MLIKKIVSVILSLSLVFMVSGCHSDKDNPLHGKAQFVEETFNQRENGLPENFLVIEDCDEFYHCLDISNGKIASWSQYDNDGVIYRFDNFYDFFRDNLENAIENF